MRGVRVWTDLLTGFGGLMRWDGGMEMAVMRVYVYAILLCCERKRKANSGGRPPSMSRRKTTLLTSSNRNIYGQPRILILQSLKVLSCQSKPNQHILHQMRRAPGRQLIVETCIDEPHKQTCRVRRDKRVCIARAEEIDDRMIRQ